MRMTRTQVMTTFCLLLVVALFNAKLVCASAQAAAATERYSIGQSSLQIVFVQENDRLRLTGLGRRDESPMLYADVQMHEAGAGPLGNPLAIIIREGAHKGIYGMDSFHLLQSSHTSDRVLAYLAHDTLPILLALDISVEGNVANWSGQVLWNGNDAVDMDVYFPLLSRVRFSASARD